MLMKQLKMLFQETRILSSDRGVLNSYDERYFYGTFFNNFRYECADWFGCVGASAGLCWLLVFVESDVGQRKCNGKRGICGTEIDVVFRGSVCVMLSNGLL